MANITETELAEKVVAAIRSALSSWERGWCELRYDKWNSGDPSFRYYVKNNG